MKSGASTGPIWIENPGGGVTMSVAVQTKDSVARTVHFLAGSGTDYTDSGDLSCYTDSSYNDGRWRYVDLDLGAHDVAYSLPPITGCSPGSAGVPPASS